MKKYVKPEVEIETFSLSKHIAACAFDMSNLKDTNECAAIGDGDYSGMLIFTDSNQMCNVYKDQMEEYCYTPASETMNVFNS